MSLTPKQKKSQSPWVDLGIFAAALAFLGYSVHFTASFAARKNIPAAKVVSEKPNRIPASQSHTPAYRNKGATEVLQLPCLSQAAPSLSSEARLMQIHAPACGDDLKQTSTWKASNETSGEEIIVFVNAKEKTFATSYFGLRHGVNKLVFRHAPGDGPAKEQRLQITRTTED